MPSDTQHLPLYWASPFLVILPAYALGCICAGYYLVHKKTGLDLRSLGSGSVGAKNAGRILGAGGFLVTLLWDFAKGVSAVCFTAYLTHDPRLQLLAGIAAVVGHIYPVQLGFKGGKGMATALGVLLAIDRQLAGVFLLLFLGWAILLRRFVLAGLTALACVPVVDLVLSKSEDRTHFLGLTLMIGVVLLAHRKNLRQELQSLTLRPTLNQSRNHLKT